MTFVGRMADAIPGVRALQRAWRRRSVESVFSRIHGDNVWGSPVSFSGTGSDDLQTRVIARELPKLLREIRATSILDIPCGDFYWMQRVDLRGIDYLGADVVPALIKSNQSKYASASLRFTKLDLTADPLPKADAVFVRDCLVHLSFKLAIRALRNIHRSGATWLITTTFVHRDANADIETGEWRPLNLERAPFNLPRPSRLLLEECTENEGKYEDKALGVWPVSCLGGL